MNKTELITAVAEKTGQSRKLTAEILNSFFNVIQDTLAMGDNIQVVGFGNFGLYERSAREGKNPANGKTIQIPAKIVVKFKPSKKLAEAASG